MINHGDHDDDLCQPSEWDDEQSSTHFTEKTGEEEARVKISTDISSSDILFVKYFKNTRACVVHIVYLCLKAAMYFVAVTTRKSKHSWDREDSRCWQALFSRSTHITIQLTKRLKPTSRVVASIQCFFLFPGDMMRNLTEAVPLSAFSFPSRGAAGELPLGRSFPHPAGLASSFSRHAGLASSF